MMKKSNLHLFVLFFAAVLVVIVVILFSKYPKNASDSASQENIQAQKSEEEQEIKVQDNQDINQNEIQPSESNDQPQTATENLLLPDIQIEPLVDPVIQTSKDGRKLLRFPGTFTNFGEGPLELIGQENPKTNTTTATQRIYKKEGAPDERLVGNFVIHPTHNHWHFENFVEFELYSYKEDGSLDKRLLTTDKMTFCIHDFAPAPSTESLPNKPARQAYPQCVSEIQGISVGWADTYQSHVAGQELDVTDTPDGRYAFHATVDPENRIVEKNENNNSSTSYIEIIDGVVKILSRP